MVKLVTVSLTDLESPQPQSKEKDASHRGSEPESTCTSWRTTWPSHLLDCCVSGILDFEYLLFILITRLLDHRSHQLDLLLWKAQQLLNVKKRRQRYCLTESVSENHSHFQILTQPCRRHYPHHIMLILCNYLSLDLETYPDRSDVRDKLLAMICPSRRWLHKVCSRCPDFSLNSAFPQYPSDSGLAHP